MKTNRLLVTFLSISLSLGLTLTSFADAKSEASTKASKKVKKTAKVERPNTKYPAYPNVHIKTNQGDIYLSLNGMRAPLTVNNFLDYVTTGKYDGTIFHRVIPGFVAQGGGHLEDYKEIEYFEPVVNESGNGLSNLTATVAMARRSEHSATGQFFINLANNQKLDPRPDRWGYAVFGEVRYGMPLLQKVASEPRGAAGIFDKDVPQKPLIIEKARLMQADEMIPMEPLVFEDEDLVDEVLDETVKKTSDKETDADTKE